MKILIGDDHRLFREGLRRVIEQIQTDARFEECGTFDEVLRQCGEQTDLDLILLDLDMPGWPGFSGIDAIVGRRPGVPVVIVSASEAHGDVRGAIDHGASGFIPKSSSVKVMMGAVNLVMSGGIYVPPGALTGLTDPLGRRSATDPVDRMVGQGLTHRQSQVLDCMRQGKSNKQIAYELGLSEGTVKIHVTAIFKSLGVKNRTQAVIAATQST